MSVRRFPVTPSRRRHGAATTDPREHEMSIDIGKVTVLGTGVLGSQIAFQCAYFGFDATAYDIGDDILAKARARFGDLAETYKREVTGADDDTVAAAQARIRLSSDLADAFGEADLVIEAIPEVLDIKRDTYTELSRVAPEKSIFATNSSTLLPSDLKAFTGRPPRFLALHFANDLWKFNIAEVMGTVETDPAVFDSIVGFAGAIGMVPISIRKEKAGYVLTSLLVPLLKAAGELAADDYANPADVDKVWRIATAAHLWFLHSYNAR